MPTQPRVAIYARVSTTDQTLDSQLRDLREYCRHRGWEPVEYVDHGVSGAKDSRPGWNSCWDAVQKRQVDVLVVETSLRPEPCRHVASRSVPSPVPEGISGPQLALNERWYRGNQRPTRVS
jgi:predicted site-specific integrase-resolvase